MHVSPVTAAVEAGVANFDKSDPSRAAQPDDVTAAAEICVDIIFERPVTAAEMNDELCPEESQKTQHAGGKSTGKAREEKLASDDDVRTPACGSPLLRMDGVRLFVF